MRLNGAGRALTALGLLALPEPKVFLRRQVHYVQDAVKRVTYGAMTLIAAAFFFLLAFIWVAIAEHAALSEVWSGPQAALGVAGTFILIGICTLLVRKFVFTKKQAVGT